MGPLYRSLNGIALPSLSKTLRLSMRARVARVGISLLVLTSPANSRVGSGEEAAEVSIEVFEGVEGLEERALVVDIAMID